MLFGTCTRTGLTAAAKSDCEIYTFVTFFQNLLNLRKLQIFARHRLVDKKFEVFKQFVRITNLKTFAIVVVFAALFASRQCIEENIIERSLRPCYTNQNRDRQELTICKQCRRIFRILEASQFAKLTARHQIGVNVKLRSLHKLIHKGRSKV